MSELLIASRGSPLALCQAEILRNELVRLGRDFRVAAHSTRGDAILDRSLQAVGGKGLFTKEPDDAVLRGDASMAVHSAKDMETDLAANLHIGAVLRREDHRDVFLSPRYDSLRSLPAGSIVGTSSLRRRAQLLYSYPHLQVQVLRGNVATRLRKLRDGDCHATILALAGLRRLGLEEALRQDFMGVHILSLSEMLSAAGQGALAVTCRADDVEICELLRQVNHIESALALMTERAFLRRLQASCSTPVGVFACIEKNVLHVRGLLAAEDGSRLVRKESRCELVGDSAAAVAENLRIGEAMAYGLADAVQEDFAR